MGEITKIFLDVNIQMVLLLLLKHNSPSKFREMNSL